MENTNDLNLIRLFFLNLLLIVDVKKNKKKDTAVQTDR